mmetsp:Transcript_16509/g.28830  ORF Transcript_16509/g.28830 Transcript_16509/m.28830 type:complete len:184 (+) Transcript_16509:139-690(+)
MADEARAAVESIGSLCKWGRLWLMRRRSITTSITSSELDSSRLECLFFLIVSTTEKIIRLNTECTVAIAISFEIEQIAAYPSTERETKKQANKQEQASRSEAKLGLRGVFSTLRNPSWRTESLLFASRSQSAADLHTCMVERFLNVQPRSNSDSQKHHSFIHSFHRPSERKVGRTSLPGSSEQ